MTQGNTVQEVEPNKKLSIPEGSFAERLIREHKLRMKTGNFGPKAIVKQYTALVTGTQEGETRQLPIWKA